MSDQTDNRVRQALQRGDETEAVTLTLAEYGEEVRSYLRARLRDAGSGDAFSMFAEDLCRGLPRFAWRCPLRSWLYTLARNAANRYVRAARRRRSRQLVLHDDLPASALVAHDRTPTLRYRRTLVKNRFRALRETLPERDQTLLILHIDRGLTFREIAQVLEGTGETPSEPVLERVAARLRKRFELAKERLRQLAQAEGLI